MNEVCTILITLLQWFIRNVINLESYDMQHELVVKGFLLRKKIEFCRGVWMKERRWKIFPSFSRVTIFFSVPFNLSTISPISHYSSLSYSNSHIRCYLDHTLVTDIADRLSTTSFTSPNIDLNLSASNHFNFYTFLITLLPFNHFNTLTHSTIFTIYYHQ